MQVQGFGERRGEGAERGAAVGGEEEDGKTGGGEEEANRRNDAGDGLSAGCVG